MSQRRKLPFTVSPSTVDQVGALFSKRFEQMKSHLGHGQAPLAEQLEELERLDRLRAYLEAQKAKRNRKFEQIAVCVFLLTLVSLSFIRLRTTAVDIEIEANEIRLGLSAQSDSTLIPGESGQVLALKRLRVSGAEFVRPLTANGGGNLELDQIDSSDKRLSDSEDRAVRLQEVTIPSGHPEEIVTRVAYGLGPSGVAIQLSGAEPVTALMGQVISVPTQRSATGPTANGYALRPIQATGKNLFLELYPLPREDELTIIRDLHIADISFEHSGHSTVLGGTVYVKAGLSGKETLQPSDRLVVRSDTPMLLRELTLSKGKLKAKLSVARAAVIEIGGDSARDLKPSVFEWIRYRWPAQLYASISTLAAAWLAIRSWMKGTA
jgi:hypothetical protein